LTIKLEPTDIISKNDFLCFFLGGGRETSADQYAISLNVQY